MPSKRTTHAHARKKPAHAPSESKPLLPLIPIPRKPRRLWVRIAMIGGSVLLIAAGIASSVLPVAPGFVFWIAGAIMLGISVPAFGRWINRMDEKLSPKWRRRLRPKLWLKGRRKLQEIR